MAARSQARQPLREGLIACIKKGDTQPAGCVSPVELQVARELSDNEFQRLGVVGYDEDRLAVVVVGVLADVPNGHGLVEANAGHGPSDVTPAGDRTDSGDGEYDCERITD